jgi:hypothetical protein
LVDGGGEEETVVTKPSSSSHGYVTLTFYAESVSLTSALLFLLVAAGRDTPLPGPRRPSRPAQMGSEPGGRPYGALTRKT